MASAETIALERGPSTLVVVANRLPVEIAGEGADAGWRRAPGGLVSALEPALRGRDATWIGWSGRAVGADGLGPELPAELDALALVDVPLTEEQVTLYYEGFANGALWPLFHDAVATPAYHRPQFEAYSDVNRIFAERAAESAPEGATVWVHDYQLLLVPRLLRTRRPDLRIGFFLHIPFPPVELFAQLPWRRQLLEGLLGADLVGFQTTEGAQNFLAATRRLLALQPGGDRVDVPLDAGHRTVRVAAFPIGIDAEAFDALARTPDVQARATQIRQEMGGFRLLFLGVDRLDYTKGIDVRMRAFAEALDEGLLDSSEVSMLQVAVPSRGNIDEYQRIRDDIELLVGRINGDLGRVGDPAIHYLHQPVSREELVAMYVAADVLLVTPLRDGMNLVAKEYIASRTDGTGAVVLSEFTGAATQLEAAFLVNPYDIEAVKRALVAVAEAPVEETGRRMALLRANVFEDDVNRWVQTFLATVEGDDSVTTEVDGPTLADAVEALAATPRLLVCCDFDGTISQLADEPSAARPVDGAVSVLDDLAALDDTWAAIVSGRALIDLTQLANVSERVSLVGSHGSEFEVGSIVAFGPRESSLLDVVVGLCRDLAADAPGVLVETKPASVAVHVRRSPPDVAARILDAVRTGPGALAGVHVLEGKSVVELAAMSGGKGDAVDVLRTRRSATGILFVGDDETDEAAFAALSVGDVGIKVGAGPTRAPWRVTDPDGVVDVLRTLAALRHATIARREVGQ